MAKILRKDEPKKTVNVITIKNTHTKSIQNFKLLPKCMIPRNKKFINTPG